MITLRGWFTLSALILLLFSCAGTPERDHFEGYVPELGIIVKVRTIKLFETGHETTPYGEREYSTLFDGGATRYIGYELLLEHPDPGREVLFALNAIWYDQAGEEAIARTSLDTRLEEGWTASAHWGGYGTGKAGTFWKPGEYRVDFFIGDELIGTSTFTVE